MNTPDVFKRVEYKYLLSPRQFDSLAESLADKIRPDEFGGSTISSLYYDTRQFAMINRSLENPSTRRSCASALTEPPKTATPSTSSPRRSSGASCTSAACPSPQTPPTRSWEVCPTGPQPNSKYGLSYQEYHHLSCTLASLVLVVVIALVYMFRHEYSKNFVVTLALLHSDGKHPAGLGASLPAGQAAARRARHRGRYSERGGSPVSMMWTSAASSRTGTSSSCAFASLLPAPGPATT